MSKKLPKAELLQEVSLERENLDELLGRLNRRQMTQGEVTLAGWSVKDILGHLIGWQQMNLGWYAAGLRGEMPEMPAPGFSWKDIRQLNDQIYRTHHRRSLDSVLVDYHDHHQKMMKLIAKLSDTDLVTVGRFNWTGPTWTLSDYIRANTASHYRWARKHIRKWLNAKTA